MQFKDNTKQRNKTIQGLRSFKDTLPKNVKKIINKKGHIYSETLNNWKYIVGGDLFKVCYPKTFKNSNKFEEEINLAFSEIRRVLKPNKYFSITYHSLSGKEWKAITNACIKNGFELVEYEWLVQKAFTPRQINRLKSIKGDVLVTLQKTSNNELIICKSDNEIEQLFVSQIENWLDGGGLETNEIFLKTMKMVFSEKILIGYVDLLKILIENFKFSENKKWILNDQLELQPTK